MTSVENEAAHFRVAITSVMGYARIIESQLCGPLPSAAAETVRQVIEAGSEIVCGMEEIIARTQQDAKSRSGSRFSVLLDLFCAETDRIVSEVESIDIDQIEEARYRDYLAEIKSSARSAKSAITACFSAFRARTA